MKTERRHELQNNELAENLSQVIEQVKPYTKAIVGGAILLGALLFAMIYVSKSRDKAQAAGWGSFLSALDSQDVAQMKGVADRFPRTEAGSWALQAAAQTNLIEGTQKLYADRSAAKQMLQDASDEFERVAQAAKDPLLRQRALFGLAQALEGQNELTKATERYDEIAKLWPDDPIAGAAAQRSELLKRPATREFYDWFFAQQPAPATSTETTLPPVSAPSSEPEFGVPAPPAGASDSEAGATSSAAGESAATESPAPAEGEASSDASSNE